MTEKAVQQNSHPVHPLILGIMVQTVRIARLPIRQVNWLQVDPLALK